MIKKLSLLFFICILSTLNINAEVYEGSCGTNVRYSLDTSTGVLNITGTGAMTNYNYAGEAPWYTNNSSINTVEISNSVTSIGENAFSGCYGLTSITIPNSVTSIGDYAFQSCYGLTSVTIPNSVTSIGSGAFDGCFGLTSVHITDVAAWCRLIFSDSFSNPLVNAHHLFMDGKEIIDLVIPNSVTSIGDYAFQSCYGLTSVTIPNIVTSIGRYAFADCSGLTSITIPNGVTSIGESAFYGCSGLTSLTIPNNVTSIGWNAFHNCSGLASISVESGNEIYDSRNNCNAIIETASKTLIVGCKSTIIPNSVTSIGGYAFFYCSDLTSVTIPNSVTSIGSNAFYYCYGLTSVTIGNSVTSIGENAFSGCYRLTSVTIPNSVTSIGYYAFEGCHSLTSVTIGNSVTSIGGSAFWGCSNLKSVTCEATSVPSTGTSVFYNVPQSSAILHVPASAIQIYKSTTPWSGFGTIVAIPDCGDANGDGKINMNDVRPIVNYILGNPDDTFNAEAADANQDGEIGMPDVMFIVNHNLNGEFPEEKEKSMVLHHPDGTESLIELSTKPLIKFLDDKVQITTNVSQKEYSQDNILSITYKDAEANEINIGSASGTIGEAFYIYRNDGEFNAFFRDEVDSITYSRYDLNNRCHKSNVTQHVYTTDSLYRIPLAVIDSIGFVQPETVFSSDVFPLTAEHVPYIVDADTLRFTMLESTPSKYRPNIGNIVVGTAECTNFPDGIIAKIIKINKISEGYNYQCESASYDDVFEQLVICSRESASEVSRSRSAVPRVNASLTLDAELWNVNWSQTIEGGGTSTVLNVGDRMTVKVTVRKTLKTPLYFQVEMQNALTSSIDFTAESSMGRFAQKQIGKTISAGRIVIPNTANLLWFVPKLSLYGYFQEEGKVELKYGGHLNRTDKVSFTYNKGKWTFNHTPLTDVGIDIAQLSMEGYAEVGLIPQVDFSLNGRRAGFGFSASIGLKEYINFIFDATKLSDGGLYDAMRDSYSRTTFPWSLTAHANADIFSKYNSNYTDVGPVTYSCTFTPRTEPQWGNDRYIFPLFNNVEANRQNIDKSTATAKSQIERSPLLPVQVGFSLLDKDNNIVQTKYDSRTYKEGSLFGNYSIDFTGVNTSEDYTVRPSVKLMGYDILASPSEELERSEFPVEITEFKQTSSEYEPNGFNYNGSYYDYKYSCSVTVCLTNSDNIEDWGYVYEDLGGNTALISLKDYGSSYTDSRYVYYRNEPSSYVRLYEYVKYKDDNEYYYGDIQDYPVSYVNSETSCPDSNHPHWIDLGLPSGTLWRCCNEGASTPEAYGGYYSFGQVSSAPTLEQIQELVSNCKYEWTTQNGVTGGKFKGPNGGVIFLPAAGLRWDGDLVHVGSSGFCWSSTPHESYPSSAYGLCFNSGNALWVYIRDRGHSVRPVR